MTTLNISLPDEMRVYVNEQIKAGGFSTASEYMRALIRDDRKRKTEERLEALLLEGVESGDAKKMTDKDWEKLRREVRSRMGKRGKRGK